APDYNLESRSPFFDMLVILDHLYVIPPSTRRQSIRNRLGDKRDCRELPQHPSSISAAMLSGSDEEPRVLGNRIRAGTRTANAIPTRASIELRCCGPSPEASGGLAARHWAALWVAAVDCVHEERVRIMENRGSQPQAVVVQGAEYRNI